MAGITGQIGGLAGEMCGGRLSSQSSQVIAPESFCRGGTRIFVYILKIHMVFIHKGIQAH